RGRDNQGSGRSGHGPRDSESNRGGGGGRGGNYPRNQHQQRGNKPGQRGQGGGKYSPHQHGGQGVGPTKVESNEGCVVGGGGGAGGGRGMWIGRPWGPIFVLGQSQPQSLPGIPLNCFIYILL
ncbi:unnamed protein product, partial [Ilex paraguariensis]